MDPFKVGLPKNLLRNIGAADPGCLTWQALSSLFCRMRTWILILAFFLGGLSACKTASPKEKTAAAERTGAPKPKRKITTSVAAAPPSRITPANTGGKPVMQPVETTMGRVIGGKDELRFVVVDFGSNRLPALDRRLNVYRSDQKVAEIKISGPYRGTTVVADIL